MHRSPLRCVLLAGASVLAGTANAQTPSEQLEDPKSSDIEIVNSVLEPKQVEPTRERLDNIDLPADFEITVFAEGLTNPRMLAVAEDGTIYVTQRSSGEITMLRDEDGDGASDMSETVATRPDMHGIAIDGDTIYLTTVHDVYRTSINEDGTLAELERIIDDLPEGGQHPNRMVVVGPDGGLYLSVGSTCNACDETSPENATILRAEPDGSYRTIFASGLRNTIGYGFEPETGELYGMDHGIDWLGDEEQAEELNHIEKGSKYGWPYIYADSKINPQDEPPNDIPAQEWADRSEEPVLTYTPHAAPMQLAFYDGDQFPEEYRGDAFVAMRGSWNRRPPSGYEIVRISFEEGEPTAIEPFVSGFVMEDGEGWSHIGRLVGLAVAGDGALLVTDDTNGVIYRIAYTGGARTADAREQSAGQTGSIEPVDEQASEYEGALAGAIVDPAEGTIDVVSSAFSAGEAIPDTYGADGQNISPPIDWAEGPEGTESYVLMMEDPDVGGSPPFVHWLLYNVPADVTSLREGRPAAPRIPVPEGALQGANDRGSTGYFGPRPPVGDPPHNYHFQVFALDKTLDLPHGADRAELIGAMQGHVLAAGEVVGTFER